MENHKLELIYKQSFYKNKKCIIPDTSMYYLNKEDFEDLIEDNYCELIDIFNDRTMRIELVVVCNQSEAYKMAFRNSERNKKVQECRKEIEEYWGQPIRLSDLNRKV